MLIVEQKSAGRDLGRAYGQAAEYFDALPERDRPRHILVSYFWTFELHDLDETGSARCAPSGRTASTATKRPPAPLGCP